MNKSIALPASLFWLLPLLAVSAETERHVPDPFRFRAYTEENKSFCLPRALAGEPAAQLWLGRYCENQVVEPFADFLKWQDKQGQNGAPPDPRLREALTWYRDAALGYLREDRPYEALMIVKRMRDDNPFNPLKYDPLSTCYADEVARSILEIKIDRVRLVQELKEVGTLEEKVTILKELLLPTALSSTVPSDITIYVLNGVSEVRGATEDHSLMVATFGDGCGGFCGTGITSGGVESPSLSGRGVNLVTIIGGNGVPLAEAHKSRNDIRVMDADGDGVAKELVITRNYFNWGTHPYLVVYDLSRADIPVMAALTFNHGYDPYASVPLGVDDKGRMVYQAGDGSPPQHRGKWVLRKDRETDYNNIVVTHTETDAGGEETQAILKFDPESRTWLMPHGVKDPFWKEGMIAENHPLTRFGEE